MKRFLSLLLIVPLSVAACRKSAAPAPGAAATDAAKAAAGAPAQPGAPGTVPGQGEAVKPVPAQLPALVAKVNGESIERWELEGAFRGVEARAGSPIPPEDRDRVIRSVLDQLVAYHVLAQEARARKLDVSSADVDGRIAQIRNNFPNEDAFQKALAVQGLTLDKLKGQTRVGLQVARVIESEISPKISVQDREVDAFYQENIERFKQGESVRASHILIGVQPNADATQKKLAQAKAQQLLKQVRAGGDFAKLAREQSQDPGSAPNGGDLGFFPKGQMDSAFEAAAFGLKPGAVSGVVETSFGFHIVKVHERRGPRTTPLAEVSGQIKEFLTERQREAKIAEFVEQAKAKIKIEILV